MTAYDDDSPQLLAAVRTALASVEPAHAPAFNRLWLAAQGPRRPGSASPRLDLAAAALTAVVAAVALLAMPRPSEPDADYVVAARLTADFDRGYPTDGWLAQVPSAPLSGGPVLPTVEYPLLPKETYL